MNNEIEAVEFHEVDASRWADMERLFEGRGGPRGCWCMIWRGTAEEARRRGGASRKAAMERRVAAGVPVGLLGYSGTTPVAWCSIAPRSTYRQLGGLEDSNEDPDAVWSLTCFFIVRRLRRQGMMMRLLRVAVEHARRRGANAVEAYPVDPDSPSYRFTGFIAAFEAAGFREVGRAGKRRHVMRLELE